MAHYCTMPWLFLTQFLLLIFHIKAKVPAVIFGDSSVDSGNNNHLLTVLQSDFRPYGRDFAAGKPTDDFQMARSPVISFRGLWVQADSTSIPIHHIIFQNSRIGVNFASAGTGYNIATSSVLNVMPLWRELKYYRDYQKRLKEYLGDGKANETVREALYFVSLGTNDFLENYFRPTSIRASQFTVEQFQDYIIGLARDFVKDLYNLGARKIPITGLPPMGCLPIRESVKLLFLEWWLQ
ncbi:hypothetical protein IFM89_008024 [Coptis chinensis]|uniref:GDSL esterase/lipase n=1 Tax=Coptis chinensis TaxID=261450 RepID=A0A835HPF5_9MAGN|nr:hypothetical protein IFM89_008024 [Coptis chinensis]